MTSFTKNILSPVLDMFSTNAFQDSFYVLRSGKNAPYQKLQDAKQDGAVVITYGSFIQTGINFLIQALCIFIFIRAITHVKRVAKA